MVNYGFCDLCINPPKGNKEELRKILQKLYELGFETVALNKNLDESIFESDKSKKKKKGNGNEQTSVIPEPMEVQDLVEHFKGRLNILSRLTFTFTDPTKTYRLGQSTILKKYNLYAVVPKSQAALQFACAQLNVDILYINSSCSGLRLNRKLYLQAIKRGVYFEIQYSDAIKLDTRKFALHWSHLFYTYGKSKNVIVTSGANNTFFLRNPYDIIFLGAIFGLNGAKAQASILMQCQNLLYKAERRIHGKSAFMIRSKDEEPKHYENHESKKIKL